jgi:hypothetical protein
MYDNELPIVSVTLRRGACFGSCPIYEVTLAADGAATWHGERFVDRIGDYQGRVDQNDVGRLTRFISRAGFLGWEPEYVADVTDLPNYFLTVVTDEQSKTVRQYGVDEPADFWVIAALVDHIAEAADWTAVAPAGECRDWTATRRQEPGGASVLRVHGVCAFPTLGYSVELRRHEPPGTNPFDLVLDRIVHPPTGLVPQVVTEVEAAYNEVSEVDYRTVTILPDGPSVRVENPGQDQAGTDASAIRGGPGR